VLTSQERNAIIRHQSLKVKVLTPFNLWITTNWIDSIKNYGQNHRIMIHKSQ